MATFLRTEFNYDIMAESNRTGLKCDPKTKDGKSLTQQSFAAEVDINTIVDRFHLSGEVPTVLRLPEYGDYEGIFDYQTAMNTIVDARNTFMTLPAKLRARFHNDPQELLEFLGDQDNREEAERLGLVNKPAPAPEGDTPPPPQAESRSAPPAKPEGEKKQGGDTPPART